MRRKSSSPTGQFVLLLLLLRRGKSVKIKCERNEDGSFSCPYQSETEWNRCCFNYELNAEYCCPIETRQEPVLDRLAGLVAAFVILITLICLLCVFCKRCPIRWMYLKRRAREQVAMPDKGSLPVAPMEHHTVDLQIKDFYE